MRRAPGFPCALCIGGRKCLITTRAFHIARPLNRDLLARESLNPGRFRLSFAGIMTLPASALPVEAPPAFLGVAHSLTGKLWRDRLDARGAARALAITQR